VPAGAETHSPSGPFVFFADLQAHLPHLEEEEAHTPRLSAADEARAAALQDVSDRQDWRAARIATRMAIENVAGQAMRRVAFNIEPSGRPVFADSDITFSIAHTERVVAIAVARAMPVGIDIEDRARKLKMSPARRERLFAALTRRVSAQDLVSERDGDVLVAWVQLEAIAKAHGIGIGRLLTQEGVIGAKPRDYAEALERLATKVIEIDRCVAAIAAPALTQAIAVRTLTLGADGLRFTT
jgi:4'-phosphopantetheinyl transferase